MKIEVEDCDKSENKSPDDAPVTMEDVMKGKD